MNIISFVIPSYNNLRYLKNAYTSIRKYAGKEHEIIVLDDASTDDTINWLHSLTDSNLVIWENTTGKRLGHTITYNVGGKLAKNEIFSILHADMFIGPNYVENALKHMKKGVVVSATRIEPPLHPEGKEKIVRDFGMWPETFKEDAFLEFVAFEQIERRGQITKGIFAPWFIHKEDFLAIGGHDPLFAPFPYEDSDIFQRFVLAGYEIIQSRDSLVYHLTCRGHKWTDNTVIGKVDNSFQVAELNARKNYLRKWNSWIKNDEHHSPIITSRYDVCAILENISSLQQLDAFEPWFSKVIVNSAPLVDEYIRKEQPYTLLNMAERISGKFEDTDLTTHDVYVIINSDSVTNEDFATIQNLNSLLKDYENFEFETGVMYEMGNLKLVINKLRDTISELIYCNRGNI
jgi:GT2 family glycosyltransferase